jgi:hypothetical protein
MKVREMLNKCENDDERYVLVYAMADAGTLVQKRYVGNEHNGWCVLDFTYQGKDYTYSPMQGGDGRGNWYVESR